MALTRLGPYEIGKELGRGGMGTVYSAVEWETGVPAAVKVLAPVLANQEGFRERFEAEIESLQQLQHPNIVRLFGFGEQDSHLYYAMELVEGTSLEEELANGRRFQWREVCHIGMDLCRALKLAHDHGIIHRDIKPANLLLSAEGRVKLTDFGIARLFGNTGLTSEGGVLGTAEYMAPEQADGRRVTHHCDLYSLGGVLYALLAGRPPFRSKSMLEMLQLQRFSQPNPVRRYAPDTPAEMEDIIAQLLEKEPKDRFPNALLVARRLEAMERALSLRPETGQTDRPISVSLTSAGFEIRKADKPVDADGSSGAVGATVDAGSIGSGVDAAPDEKHPDSLSEPLDDDAIGRSQIDDADEQEETGEQRENRFTTIEEARRQAELRRQPDHPLISAPTWMLIAAIVATGIAVWYMLQPPSADRLLVRIRAAAKAADEKRLLDVETQVKDFIKYYPNHEKDKEVRQYLRRINALRLEQRAKLQARLLIKRYPDSTIGRDYLAAIELSETDPENAVIRLQALIDLYGQSAETPSSVSVFVVAAELQLRRIQEQIERRAAAQTETLEQRLKVAYQSLRKNPDESRKICQAIVTLYQNKPWAKEVVAKARATLVVLDEQ